MIPPVTDTIWEKLVKGQITPQFHLLSLKIMMSRIYRKLQEDPSEIQVKQCTFEVHDFFSKNEKIIFKDLAEIIK